MKRKIITTADGSKTIYLSDWDEHYHSKHGAVQESQYVFIDKGLKHICSHSNNNSLDILEIGFGTGLNAYLTLLESQKNNVNINYVGVEGYPVPLDEVKELNYASEDDPFYNQLHEVSWEESHDINDSFTLTKKEMFFSEINFDDQFDLIYFDAFGARVQPELWEKPMFRRMYNALRLGGVLVTYAAIGQVKRDMLTLGFAVERLPGPPGKRHMLRATK